jgi:hypothetical protein
MLKIQAQAAWAPAHSTMSKKNQRTWLNESRESNLVAQRLTKTAPISESANYAQTKN